MMVEYKGDSERVLIMSDHDTLLEGKKPCVERVRSYLPARKRTVAFDVGVLCMCTILFAIVMSVSIKFAIIPALFKPETTSPAIETADTRHGWIKRYDNLGSESVVRLLDVNGDGVDDIIFGVAQPLDTELIFTQNSGCSGYKDGCRGAIIALDGHTGNSLWNLSTYSEVFELNCGNADLNGDGQKDCVGAGRKGTYTGFDYKRGRWIWTPQSGHESYINYEWNIYNPLVINDVNGDSIPEIILCHGGDPRYSSENKTRPAGQLVLIDGSTGSQLRGYAAIDMPDGKETYNSPILHRDKAGVTYILLGTGGETVAGGLYISRIDDLINFMKIPSHSHSPEPIKHLESYASGFFAIFKAKEKGVMVPVVRVDINADNCLDIIVTSFDGTLRAYDGDNFKLLWQYMDAEGETYTTPAVGYFNGDSTLDVMVHWNYGTWPFYNRSTVMVHSGKDGTALWSFNTTRFSMTSDLVIRTSNEYEDVFVFRVQGREGDVLDSEIGVIHGVDPQRKLGDVGREKRSEPTCTSSDLSNMASEVFAVSWSTRHAPRRIFRKEVDKFYYNQDQKIEHQRESSFVSKAACAIMEQSSRTTGAIGDINNDGKLDLVLTFNAQGEIRDRSGGYLRMQSSLDIAVIELEKQFTQFPMMGDERLQQGVAEPMEFLSKQNQIWTGYMGRYSLSSYRT